MDGPALAALAKALEGFAGRLLDYPLVLAAIGTVTMALLELLKAVGRARYVFNRRMVERWLGADPAVRREVLDPPARRAAGAPARPPPRPPRLPARRPPPGGGGGRRPAREALRAAHRRAGPARGRVAGAVRG